MEKMEEEEVGVEERGGAAWEPLRRAQTLCRSFANGDIVPRGAVIRALSMLTHIALNTAPVSRTVRKKRWRTGKKTPFGFLCCAFRFRKP